MKPNSGVVLLMTLLITSVIAMLILGHAKSLINFSKSVWLFQARQQDDVQFQQYFAKLYQSYLSKTLLPNASCIFHQSGQAQFATGDEVGEWCVVPSKKNLKMAYRLYESSAVCCLQSNTGNPIKLVQILLRVQMGEPTRMKGQIYAMNNYNKQNNSTCQCQKTFAIKVGFIGTYQH